MSCQLDSTEGDNGSADTNGRIIFRSRYACSAATSHPGALGLYLFITRYIKSRVFQSRFSIHLLASNVICLEISTIELQDEFPRGVVGCSVSGSRSQVKEFVIYVHVVE